MDTDYLTLKRASASRPSGEWSDDDYDVLADGKVVGRIFKVQAAPVGTPWLWTLSAQAGAFDRRCYQAGAFCLFDKLAEGGKPSGVTLRDRHRQQVDSVSLVQHSCAGQVGCIVEQWWAGSARG